MTAPIVLLTDFGTQDSYIGVMKGVIAGIAPGVPLIDLTHEIRPQDVAHGAYTLAVSVPYFPAGTIFCCVVDPGVGSARRAVAVGLGEWRFVLPDNGLLTPLLGRWEVGWVISLENPRYQLAQPSATFHGRDIFAPAAAHLAAGVEPAALGKPVAASDLQRLERPPNRQEAGRWIGRVLHVDRFGNLISSLTRDELGSTEGWRVRLDGTDIALPRIQRTFADVPPGEPVAYVGSDGFLELAIRNGSAASMWGVGVGSTVVAEKHRERVA